MARRSTPGRALAATACALLLALAGCAEAKAPAGAATTPATGLHRAAREAVPILMYHVIGAVPADARLPSLFVSPRDFRGQIAALRGAGYHGVTLQQVWNAWQRGGRLPRRPVVLSFDDGSRGHVRHALPVLRRHGWPGVLNLAWRFLPDIGGVAAVRRLVGAGWEVDSHSLNHPDLTQLPATDLRRELRESRARIRRAFGAGAASFFAYPAGRFDARVKRAVKAAGYKAAMTVQRAYARPTDDPYALPRIQVDGGMSGAQLLRRLRDLERAT